MVFRDHPTQKMDFGHINSAEELKSVRQQSNEWKVMTEFIFNQDPHSFRKSCQSINQTLYAELSKMSEWIKRLRNRSKENPKYLGTRVNLYNRSNSTSQVEQIEISQMRRLGVSKLQNIIQKVLASHVQKVQDKKESGLGEIKPKPQSDPDPESSNIDPMLEALKESSTNQDDKQILDSEEDKKFFKLMKKLLINGTVPK